MRRITRPNFFISFIVALSSFLSPTFADDFSNKVNLREIRTITVQDRQTLKTLDTFARQTLYAISGKSRWDDQDPVYTLLDIACRPDEYTKRNVVRVHNAVLRQDFQRLTNLDSVERDRILKEGSISLELWNSPEVQQLMSQLQSTAIFKAKAIGEVAQAAGVLQDLSGNLAALKLIPPPPAGQTGEKRWRGFGEIVGNVKEWNEVAKRDGRVPPAPVAGYDDALVGETFMRLVNVTLDWRDQHVDRVNDEFKVLPGLLGRINVNEYPSQLNRDVELTYNKLTKLTIPGAFLYFAAFVCFLVSARSGLTGVRLWGLRIFTLAYIVHTVGIGIRWWLVATQHNSWFDGIPIKNQFESVLMSAWFGATLGLILEMRRSRAIFGAAASFVGWLSLVAIFAAPFVTGVEIGGEIGQVSGVLMSYWLYLHVTLVTASYAMITMGFGLSIWWLVGFYRNYGTLRRTPARQLSSDVVDLDTISFVGGNSGAIQVGFARTLAMMFFVPGSRVMKSQMVSRSTAEQEKVDTGARFLATLDACNLVILQLAFWVLGVGIILGAVWADQSWGRPWGWDPKETFAAVTWIVYLIVVHVRIATKDKAWWTAVLSIVGFFVMLFNWIGVNFFLVGLHSYA